MAVGQQDLRAGGSAADSPRLLLWLKIVAVILAIGFPIQAFLASEALYKANDDMRTAHEQLGNVLFLLAIAQIVLGFIALRSGLIATQGIVLRTVFFVLVIVQFALGYAGRENLDPRIWHIPNGVLLMGLAAVIAAMSFQRNPS